MTIAQIGELLQRFVKNGTVRGRDTMTKQDYANLAILARDYILFAKKSGDNNMFFKIADVEAEPKDIEIKSDTVILPIGFNIQGITNVALLDKSETEMPDMVIRVSGGESVNITDKIFIYFILMQKKGTFKNRNGKGYKLRLYTIAGSDPGDQVSNDVAFIIFKECMKIGQMSEEKRKDTSADGNTFDDYLKNQIKQFINAPDNIDS
jgi:hypothetical protein